MRLANSRQQDFNILAKCVQSNASSLEVHAQVNVLPMPSMAFLKAAASSPGLNPGFSLTVPRAVDLIRHS